jgi:hypothetical protein
MLMVICGSPFVVAGLRLWPSTPWQREQSITSITLPTGEPHRAYRHRDEQT